MASPSETDAGPAADVADTGDTTSTGDTADIVLVAINAKYIHTSFGLRYLLANLGELRQRARLMEFVSSDRAADIVEAVLAAQPRIVGIGVYVWNVELAAAVVDLLVRVAPSVRVVLGGPEVSHETADQAIVKRADYVIRGEGELEFRSLARAILQAHAPTRGVRSPTLPDLEHLILPYDDYAADDIAHRVVYVEASRGCPFKCQFCLSALDERVRTFPLAPFLAAMQRLFDRGVRHFKFVDRTFNLDLERSRAILEFFADLVQADADLLVHFEMVPDRLPLALRDIIAAFPAGVLQFEVGIQTFDPVVAERIDRRHDPAKMADNLRWLRDHTGVHVHADLIVGLPGETLAGFARGFDQLMVLRPQEIQVGILKRLRGAPIAVHDAEWHMVYSGQPPYQLLRSKTLAFEVMQEMGRFARFWDLIGNSGHYVEILALALAVESPFATFRKLCRELYARFGRAHGIAATAIATAIFEHLTRHGHATGQVAAKLIDDHLRGGRRQIPAVLRPFLTDDQRSDIADRRGGNPAAKRQRAAGAD